MPSKIRPVAFGHTPMPRGLAIKAIKKCRDDGPNTPLTKLLAKQLADAGLLAYEFNLDLWLVNHPIDGWQVAEWMPVYA